MTVVEAAIIELKRLAYTCRSCGDDDYAVQYGIESVLGIARSTGCHGEVIRQFDAIGKDDKECNRLIRSYWHLRVNGCGVKLKEGQWWRYCGETDMGQTIPNLCKECGGEYERDQ